MRLKIIVGLILVGFGLGNCQKMQQSPLATDAQLMASLECEARHLKEERFKVANDIRFMEDSLAKRKLSLSANQRAKIDSIKENYTLRTGQLADKITKTMDSLFATTYHSSEERQQLDEEVEKVLQKSCH